MSSITNGSSRVLLLTLGAVGLLACTSLGHKRSNADDDGVAAGKDRGAVVTQISKTDPVVSSHDRKFWLDSRQATKAMPKLQGALATGESEAAVGLAKGYLAKHPGDVQGMTMLAAALTMNRNYDLAGYYASLVERAQPGNSAALNIKGLVLALGSSGKMRDYRKAVELFRQAFDADTAQIAAGLNLGSLYLELGSAGSAVQVFDEVVSRCGSCTPGLMGLGVALSRGRQFDRAAKAFAEVLDKNPNHASALYNLALVHRNGYNDNKQAEKYLFAVLNDSRSKDIALKERAQTVLRMIKGEATTEERTALADDEDSAPAAASDKDAELLMTGSEMEDAN